MYYTKTNCKRCGKRIFLIRLDSGKTVPCEIALTPFVPDVCGTARYVMDDGTVLNGCEPLDEDPDVHHGHMDHRFTCSHIPENRRRRK